MGQKKSLALRLTFLLSLSLTASQSSSYSFLSLKSSSSPSPPQATPSDLLSLLGPPSQSSSVKPVVADELRSCFKFLVPLSPIEPTVTPALKSSSIGRKMIGTARREGEEVIKRRKAEDEDRLVWWPPEPVLELARIAVDSGGDVGVIHRALDPSPIPFCNRFRMLKSRRRTNVSSQEHHMEDASLVRS